VVAVVLAIVLSSGGKTTTNDATTKGGTTLAPSDSVLSASYAKSIGYPNVVQPVKQIAQKGQKGCTTSVSAVYEDGGKVTGLISDVLNCESTTSASNAFLAARKQVSVDPSMKPPAGLGSSAFVTTSNAPEYLVVWRAGTRVAITAMDVDIQATSSSTSTTAPTAPITQAQVNTLYKAALEQNSLYA
jgi:hypothetical protein